MQYLNSNKASIYLTFFLATKYSITHTLIYLFFLSIINKSNFVIKYYV